MSTTTRVATTEILDSQDWDWGDENPAEFHLEAIEVELHAAVQTFLPVGVTLTRDGELFAKVTPGEHAAPTAEEGAPYCGCPSCRIPSIDWAEIRTFVDFTEIISRHHL
jgi:hypothetical protein